MTKAQKLVQKIANFANITLDKQKIKMYIQQFNEMVKFTKQVQEPDTDKLPPTFQTNNNQNITRPDQPSETRILSYKAIKKMSKKSKFKDGYFVIKSETFKSWQN